MNLKQLVVMSAVAVATGCTSSQQHTRTPFDEYPVYEGESVEMAYTPASTRFSLWAPSAQEVRVLLYEKGQGGSAYRMVKMEPESDGMWQARVDEDLKGKFYTFNVKIDNVWQGDTPGLMAKAVGVNGDRAAVIDWKETNPEGWNEDKRPPLKRFSDMVIYELHHRDFSIDTISGIRNRGKFLALTEEGTHTYLGEETGIDHLEGVGVTHVQLLPSFDFLRWTKPSSTNRSTTGDMTRKTTTCQKVRMPPTLISPKCVSASSSRWSWHFTGRHPGSDGRGV